MCVSACTQTHRNRVRVREGWACCNIANLPLEIQTRRSNTAHWSWPFLDLSWSSVLCRKRSTAKLGKGCRFIFSGEHCTLHLFLCLSLSSWESTKQTWKDIKFCNSDVLTVSDFGFCSARYTFLVAHTYRKRGQLPDRRACGLNNATGIDVLSRNLKKQIQLASQLQGK